MIDASRSVIAVHQNHDYSHHPLGSKGVLEGEEAKRNHELAGGWDHIFTVDNAQYRLGEDGLKWCHHYLILDLKTFWKKVCRLPWLVWFTLLGVTRPVRHALGLRQRKAVENPTEPNRG